MPAGSRIRPPAWCTSAPATTTRRPAAGVDNGGLEKTGTKDGIDVSAKCGDVGVGAEASLDDTGCLKYGPTGSAGPIKVKKGPKAQVKADVDGAPKVKLSTKCSASGKVYGKACTQGKF